MTENLNFSFVNYRVVQLKFDVNKNFGKKYSSETESIEVNPSIEISYEKEKNILLVDLTIIFDNMKAPFSFLVRCEGMFKFNYDIFNKNMERIVNINCAAILFPFVREIIAELTRRANFPPLLLPPVNFVNLYKKKNNGLPQTEKKN